MTFSWILTLSDIPHLVYGAWKRISIGNRSSFSRYLIWLQELARVYKCDTSRGMKTQESKMRKGSSRPQRMRFTFILFTRSERVFQNFLTVPSSLKSTAFASQLLWQVCRVISPLNKPVADVFKLIRALFTFFNVKLSMQFPCLG